MFEQPASAVDVWFTITKSVKVFRGNRKNTPTSNQLSRKSPIVFLSKNSKLNITYVGTANPTLLSSFRPFSVIFYHDFHVVTNKKALEWVAILNRPLFVEEKPVVEKPSSRFLVFSWSSNLVHLLFTRYTQNVSRHSSPRNLLPWYHSPMISTLHNHEKCKMTALVEETSLGEAISSHDDRRKSNTPTNSIRDLIVPQLFGSNPWFQGHVWFFTILKKLTNPPFPPNCPNIAQGTKAAPSSLSVSYLACQPPGSWCHFKGIKTFIWCWCEGGGEHPRI